MQFRQDRHGEIKVRVDGDVCSVSAWNWKSLVRSPVALIYVYFTDFRFRQNAKPAKPLPSRSIVDGSGTGIAAKAS